MPVRRLPFLAAPVLTLALVVAGCGAKADKAAADAPKGEAPTATAPTGDPPGASATRASDTGPSETSPLPPTAGSKLASYVGKYPFDKVDGVAWNDHALVKAGIAATVTDAAVRKAITTLQGPAAPIEMRGDKIVSWACEAHNCGPHQWSVQIDPRSGATDVCYFDEAADPDKARWFLASGKEEKREANCQ
ncbi:hypothetical protein CVO77_09635 [Sphingopyxis lindanitolerans]|uniref:Inhibitor of lysozyme (Ivy) n=1 Tax=Sphingopyxis lindanitolerans TaxID=2054227 RepID=A0A2S8B8F0_9SPHN|nr:hypothetical protein [Sphingopyxis lindanitolerans]PQM28685.1 hypothetical protein CVO77_09635 [Sphingopyxis lindanitolerans]